MHSLLRCSLAPVFLLAFGLPTARAQIRHAVFSLIDNRPLGHSQRRGGLVIEAGLPGMAKYVHFQRPLPLWKLQVVEDGRRVALAQAQAVLEVPLTQAQAAGNVVYLALKAPASTVRVAAGGKTSAAVPLKAGWQVATIPLPAGALAAGENTLRLTFASWGKFAGQRAAAAVELIQVGGSPPPPESERPVPGKLVLPSGGGYAWYGFVPEGGALAATGNGGGCQVRLRVEAPAAQVFEAEVRLDGTPVDLSRLGGRFARIVLGATGSCQVVTLHRGELQAAGPSPVLASARPPRNIVFWLTDATRADKYKLYNPKSRVVTPTFDELAKRSTVFRVAYTQGNESRVSHASLWTSLYPSVHQMIPAKAKLKPEFVTLAEAVKPSGRITLGVTGNGYVSKRWGFGDGWDHFENHIHEGGGLKAEDLFASAKKLLDKRGDKPFFLYVGTIDGHVSWRAHEPWIRQYDPEPYKGPFVKALLDPVLEKIVAGQMKVTERDKVRVRAIYDSDISYNDHVMGQLIEDLRRRGLFEDTMFIMTADHGEEFWEHGKIGHGQSLRGELVHVPLLISYPPCFPQGKIVEEGVDVMDILPTLTEALGVPTSETFQGASLIPLAQGVGAGYPRPAIASQYELAHTMRLGRYKIWVGGSGEVRLFDAAVDFGEDHDLATSRPFERRVLTDALGLWMAFRNQWRKRDFGVASNLLPGFTSRLEK